MHCLLVLHLCPRATPLDIGGVDIGCTVIMSLRQLCDNFKKYGIPLDVLVIDMDWHYTDKGRGSWTGWTWNKELFPHYRKLLKDLKTDNGIRVTLNLHPAEGVKSYEEQV